MRTKRLSQPSPELRLSIAPHKSSAVIVLLRMKYVAQNKWK